MNNYDKVEELYEAIMQHDQNHPLKEKATRFHVMHENFRAGAGDVIAGLQAMDELADEIVEDLKTKRINGSNLNVRST